MSRIVIKNGNNIKMKNVNFKNCEEEIFIENGSNVTIDGEEVKCNKEEDDG